MLEDCGIKAECLQCRVASAWRTIPLLSLWAGAEHESFADAEFEPVARLQSISEIAH